MFKFKRHEILRENEQQNNSEEERSSIFTTSSLKSINQTKPNQILNGNNRPVYYYNNTQKIEGSSDNE